MYALLCEIKLSFCKRITFDDPNYPYYIVGESSAISGGDVTTCACRTQIAGICNKSLLFLIFSCCANDMERNLSKNSENNECRKPQVNGWRCAAMFYGKRSVDNIGSF